MMRWLPWKRGQYHARSLVEAETQRVQEATTSERLRANLLKVLGGGLALLIMVSFVIVVVIPLIQALVTACGGGSA